MGILLAVIGLTCLIVVEYNAYSAVVELSQDKKLCIFIIAKAIVTVSAVLLLFFIAFGNKGGIIEKIFT